MKRYTVVYQRTQNNWSAYCPDVPGCVATSKTREEVELRFREALAAHLELMREEGLPIPEPASEFGYVEVTA